MTAVRFAQQTGNGPNIRQSIRNIQTLLLAAGYWSYGPLQFVKEHHPLVPPHHPLIPCPYLTNTQHPLMTIDHPLMTGSQSYHPLLTLSARQDGHRPRNGFFTC